MSVVSHNSITKIHICMFCPQCVKFEIKLTSVCVIVSGAETVGDLGVFCSASFKVNLDAVAGMLMMSLS